MSLPAIVVDPIIRAKAAIHETPLERFQVRVARTVEEYEEAFGLLHVAYAYQGIERFNALRLRSIPQHMLPESLVLVAYEGDNIVGTMTVTLDSPAGVPNLPGDVRFR